MSWLPGKGDLFYVRMLTKVRVIAGNFGAETVVKQEDGSYKENIFKLIASDDRMLYGETVYGSDYVSDKKHLFVRQLIEAMPVGPDIVKALSLSIDPE